MKFALYASLVASASAFTAPSMTFAVGKKPAMGMAKPVATKAVKKAPVMKAAPMKAPVMKAAPMKAPVMKAPVMKAPVMKAPVMKAPVMKAPPAMKAAPKPAPVAKAAPVGTIPSQAIPYESAPALLDGSLVGDVGFDPCFLSTKASGQAQYFNSLFAGNAPIDGLTWYREAELMHGRICMVAVVGFIIPGFGTFPGNDWTGADAFSTTNPLEALSAAPSASLFQIFAFMAGMEFRRISIITEQGASYMAGDSQRWGQGEGRWNPLGLNYTPEEYAEKQLQEIKHARLAMIGLLGLIFQANASGVNVVQQWSTAFISPDYYTKAGYWFPEGI